MESFDLKVLPEPYGRVDESHVDLLMSLVNKIKDQLMDRLNDFKQKELPFYRWLPY